MFPKLLDALSSVVNTIDPFLFISKHDIPNKPRNSLNLRSFEEEEVFFIR